MEASAVQQQKNPLVCSSLAEGGKLGQRNSEGVNRDSRHQQPEGSAAGRMQKPISKQPLIAVMNQDSCSTAAQCPPSPQDGLQADAMLIHRPNLNTACGQDLLNGVHKLRPCFF